MGRDATTKTKGGQGMSKGRVKRGNRMHMANSGDPSGAGGLRKGRKSKRHARKIRGRSSGRY